MLRSVILCLPLAMAVSAASAATISHSAPREPVLVDATAATNLPASSLPYACDKSEANTHLAHRNCG